MGIEEKAKAYDEALKRAEAAIDIAADKDLVKGVATTIFPELRESEDERIRKELIETIRCISDDCSVFLSEQQRDRYLDWLEKQKEPHYTKRNALFDKCVAECDPAVMKEVSDEIDEMLGKEQKPNIEICPHSIKSKSYKENGYPIEDCDYGLEIALNILEKTLGKVQGFQTDDGIREHQTAIEAVRKAQEQKPVDDIIGRAISYFGAESLLDNANGLSNFEKFTAWLYCEFLRGLPKKLNQEYIKEQTSVILDAAQKELCKMPDSTKLIEMWDKEKANLEEKDFRGDTWRIAYNAFMDGFAKGTCVKFDRQKEQKPVEWSEEDERMLKSIIWHISYSVTNGKNTDCKCDLTEWLKEKLKSLRPQKLDASKLENFDPVDVLNRIKTEWPMAWEKVVRKEEWSEEDEEIRQSIIKNIKWERDNTPVTVDKDIRKYDEQINWLKSLRPSWKPSEEQMEALNYAIAEWDGGKKLEGLYSLRNDLKKLM